MFISETKLTFGKL